MAKNPLELSNELQVNETPVFNQEEQDARKKAGRRFISKNELGNGKFNYIVSGDPYAAPNSPNAQTKWFYDSQYNKAYDYLLKAEAEEEARRKKLVDDYYNGQGDLEQLHSNILKEFGGNYEQAFNWLYKNARRY